MRQLTIAKTDYNGGIKTPLMKQQQLIVDFAKGKKYVGIFGDYGIGKSLAGLAIVAMYKMRYVLIVSTKTGVEATWPTELVRHTNLRWFQIKGTRKAKLAILARGIKTSYIDSTFYYNKYNKCAHTVVFLINFDGVKNIASELADVMFDGMFVDESRKIKNIYTKRTEYIWALGWKCKRRYILTGFPISEGLKDLYAQIKFLDGGLSLGNSYYKFLHENFARQGPHFIPKRKSLRRIIDAISPFCLRITNKHLNLPPTVYKTINIQQTPEQRKALKELNSMFQLEFGKVKIDIQHVFSLISRSLQICDGYIEDLPPKDPDTGKRLRKPIREIIHTNKDEALLEILEEIDVEKNKVVIWANHSFAVLKIVTLLTKIYSKQGIKVLELHGKTLDAKTVVDKFQTYAKHNIIVMSIKKAAESITLTSARYNIHYGHQWSFDIRDNSDARTRRIGSDPHKSITYINLVTKGTVEVNVVRCVKNKYDLVGNLKEAFLRLTGGELVDD